MGGILDSYYSAAGYRYGIRDAMIIARAPLHITLAGDGTDLPEYADQFGGLVVSTTVDRYVHIALADPREEAALATGTANGNDLSRLDDLAIGWRRCDEASAPIAHCRLIRRALARLSIDGDWRLFVSPPGLPGAALGAFGAATTALSLALTPGMRHPLSMLETADRLYRDARTDGCGALGRHDLLASLFGDLNVFGFLRDTTVITPAALTGPLRHAFQQRLLLFLINQQHRPTAIPPEFAALHESKAVAVALLAALEERDLEAVGELFGRWGDHQAWGHDSAFDAEIAGVLARARDAGARGGRLTGHGEHRYLLVYAEPERRRAVIQQLTRLGLLWVDTAFEHEGATAGRQGTRPVASRLERRG